MAKVRCWRCRKTWDNVIQDGHDCPQTGKLVVPAPQFKKGNTGKEFFIRFTEKQLKETLRILKVFPGGDPVVKQAVMEKLGAAFCGEGMSAANILQNGRCEGCAKLQQFCICEVEEEEGLVDGQ